MSKRDPFAASTTKAGLSLPPGLRLQPGASALDIAEFQKALVERMEREKEALKLYRPLPFQERYHECKAKEVILAKGNRAGGPVPLSTPVLTPSGWVPMGDLKVGNQVIGGDGKPCNVTHVFEQGWLPIYRMTFDDGASVCCSEDHYWKCKLKKTERFPSHPNYRADKWGVYSLEEIRRHGGDNPTPRERAVIPIAECEFPEQPVPLDPYALGVLLGDGSISQNSVSFTSEDREIAEFVHAGVAEYGGRVSSRQQRMDTKGQVYGVIAQHNPTTGKPSPVKQALESLGLMGHLSHEKFIPELYLQNSLKCRLELLRGLMDTDGYCSKSGHTYFYTNSPALAEGVVQLVRSIGGKAKIRWKETSITERIKKQGRPFDRSDKQIALPFRKKCLNMAVVWIDYPHASPFKLERKTKRWESRKRLPVHGRFLERIEPAGNAPCRCIRVDSSDHTFVTKDYIVTHNSLTGFVEDARAVLGRDPHGKYPKRGTLVCVGWGETHIGNVIYRYLFEPGAFQIIYDAVLGGYRVFNPNTDPVELAEPAPPLIPQKHVIQDSWAWIDKRAKIFKHVEIETKDTFWRIITGNSNGSADHLQGINVNLYHIDEDVARSGWYDEAIARTMAVSGLIRWTAMPHAETDDIVNMMRRAEEQAGSETPDTVLVRASIDDNPYLPKKEVEASKRLWIAQGEDVYRMRVFGTLTLDSVRMYPGFETYTHDAIPYEIDNTPGSGRTADDVRKDAAISPVQREMILSDGVPPDDWCCYATIDPGHTIAAALFFAVPPPSLGCDQVVVFDELYIPQCDAAKFAKVFSQKVGTRTFQSFIIDAHGGALREIGSGIRPMDQYRMALEKLGVRSVETGSGFMYGSDDTTGREHLVRDWLQIGGDGRSKALVVVDKCPNFCREMRGFKKKRVNIGGKKVTIDEGDRRSDTHSVEAFEYGVAHGLRYVSPRTKPIVLSMVDRWKSRQAMRERARQMKSRFMAIGSGAGAHVNLGPNGS